MKKVLLSSVAALAVFSATAPVFAQGENPASSNQLIQKKYVSERDIADEVNKEVAAHEADINAEAEKDAAVVAAKAALEAYGSGHLYGEYVAKLDAARAEARTIVRNRYVQEMQEKLRNTLPNQYNDPKLDNERNEDRIAKDQEAQGKAPVASADAANNGAKPGAAKPGVAANKDEAKNSESKAGVAAKAGKADSKQAGKALPKTSAVK